MCIDVIALSFPRPAEGSCVCWGPEGCCFGPKRFWHSADVPGSDPLEAGRFLSYVLNFCLGAQCSIANAFYELHATIYELHTKYTALHSMLTDLEREPLRICENVRM